MAELLLARRDLCPYKEVQGTARIQFKAMEGSNPRGPALEYGGGGVIFFKQIFVWENW